MSDFMKEYSLWSTDPYFSDKTREELLALEGNDAEIYERFYQNLSFGTAGLRGILGAGTNRMNEYTIAQAAEGFARYLDTLGEAKQRGVAISFDSRHRSQEFAQISASILASHGIPCYIFDELRPVPILSFTVRHLDCIGGIMITASHNPSIYNGYKVYGEDGGQLPPEAADKVASEMAEISDYRTLEWKDFSEWEEDSLVHVIGEAIDQEYMKMLKSLSISPEAIQANKDMKIVYTPLHGAGNKPVRRILNEIGFENVYVVPEQEKPDGSFPTVDFPNPEERSALAMAIDLAEKEEASLVIATDPDADRTGLAVRMPDGNYQVMTGNQIGLLLMEYILSTKFEKNALPFDSFCVTTIVSSRLAKKICAYYDVELFITLTGFKFIAEQIQKYDELGDMHFQFGYEESFGYLAGTSVRDKDAVVASMLLAELAAVCALEGKTLYDRLQDIYQKYSYASEETVSLVSEGSAGKEKIANAMRALRENKGQELAGIPVKYLRDYKTSKRHNLETGVVETLNIPESNVLLYELNDMDWMCVRPSGTEPKLKIYFGTYDEDAQEADRKRENIQSKLVDYVKNLL